MKLKNLLILLFISIVATASAQLKDYSMFDKKFNFYIANDLGRNGYYDQKPIAELMGTMGEEIGPEFVLAAGDVHHFEGVRSVNDPLWMTNFELIYSHPELMIDWYPVLGNHEYRGNTQAVLDYSGVSRRWLKMFSSAPLDHACPLLHQDIRRKRSHRPHRLDRYCSSDR